jgi:hypothetical protein
VPLMPELLSEARNTKASAISSASMGAFDNVSNSPEPVFSGLKCNTRTGLDSTVRHDQHKKS